MPGDDLQFYCDTSVDQRSSTAPLQPFEFPGGGGGLLSVSMVAERNPQAAEAELWPYICDLCSVAAVSSSSPPNSLSPPSLSTNAPSPSQVPDLPALTFRPETQTGVEFTKIVKAVIDNPHITKITFLNTSYLQRYNKALELLALLTTKNPAIEIAKNTDLEERIMEAAQRLAHSDSLAWQDQNKEGLDLLRSSGKFAGIVEWQSLYFSGEFAAQLRRVNDLRDSPRSKADGEFGRNVKQLVDRFYATKLPKLVLDAAKVPGSKLTEAIIKLYLRKFVCEECAMRTLMHFIYEIYRGEMGYAVKMAHDRFGVEGEMIPVDVGTIEELTRRHSPRAGDQTNIAAPNTVSSCGDSSSISTSGLGCSSAMFTPDNQVPQSAEDCALLQQMLIEHTAKVNGRMSMYMLLMLTVNSKISQHQQLSSGEIKQLAEMKKFLYHLLPTSQSSASQAQVSTSVTNSH